MDLQHIAIIGACASTAMLTLFYLYVYCIEKQKVMGIFTLAWMVYTVRLFFMLISVATGDKLPWMLLNQLASMINGLLLLLGICLWFKKKIPLYSLIFIIPFFIWVLYANLWDVEFFWAALPTFFFLGVVNVLAGGMYLARKDLKWRYLIGIAFIIWGIHKWDYPWLWPVEELSPYGYLLSMLCTLIIAGGLLVSYLRSTQKKLQNSEKMFNQLADNLKDAFWIVSPDWNEVSYISPAYEEIWEKSCKSLYDQPSSWMDSIIDADHQTIVDAVEQKKNNNISDPTFPEYRIKTQSGKTKWVLAQAYPVYDEYGNVQAIAGLSKDISDWKNAELKIKHTRDMLEIIVDCRHIIMHTVDQLQMLDDICKVLVKKMGYPLVWVGMKQEDVPKSVKPVAAYGSQKKYIQKIFISWDDSQFGQGPTGMAIKTGEVQIKRDFNDDSYHPWLKPAGDHGFRSSIALPLIDAGKAIGALNIYSGNQNDFSDFTVPFLLELAGDIVYGIKLMDARQMRDKAEQTLREREKGFRRMLESSAVGIHCGSFDGKIVYSNEAFIKMVGYSREEFESGAVGWESLTLLEYTDIDKKAIEELRLTGHAKPYQKEFIRKDGSRFPVLISASLAEELPYDAIAFVIDLSELEQAKKQRDELQDELRQAQKMDAVGQLAGGIAHDFNNILMAIQGNADLMISMDIVNEKGKEFLEEIIQATTRAADLTNQLLTFSRKRDIEIKPVDIHEIICEVNALVSRSIIKSVTQEIDLNAKDTIVNGDYTQLQSSLLNMAINARDAMHDGGKLTFSTRNIALDEQQRSIAKSLAKAEKYIEISVMDTGHGISPDDIDRIFEPFFTTKNVGEGTGLGLASVYGCIKAHHGYIDVKSEPGNTVFTVILPVVSPQESLDTCKDQEDVVVQPSPAGSIMVIDDEPSVRAFMRATLESNGYKVQCISEGQEAVDVLKENKNKISLVILDIVMPKVSGPETFKLIKEVAPDVKILLMSGYSRDVTVEQLMNQGAVGFISKPFRLKVFMKMISRYMGSGSA